jgi:hypothetical protein
MDKSKLLINMLNNKYAELLDIEQKYHIFGMQGDFRPRIDYYHDAVRAYNDANDDGLSRNSRLAAERLADDVEMLRQITARPLIVGRIQESLSPSDALTVNQFSGYDMRPDATTKRQLTSLYRDYTVFFVALMIDKTEDNIESRTQENDIIVQDCYRLEQALAGLQNGTMSVESVRAAANMLEHDGMRIKIMNMLSKSTPNSQEINESITKLQDVRRSLAVERKTLDAAGMRFASSQLMIYEGAKDIVKNLMQNGINIAGKHTESAMQNNQTSRDRGI